jgi:hypothetical protein
MKTYTLPEVHTAFAAQCGTVQSMASLVQSGAEPDSVHKSFGFSCEGRFNGAGAWPNDKEAQATREKRGCNWTLGGLFQIHTAEVQQEDGTVEPTFDVATPEEAQALELELGVAAVSGERLSA